jgi:thiol-disulfide isomerase/thioredoxin
MIKAAVYEDYSNFIKQNGITVIKYFMTNCPPCRLLKPTFEKLVIENSLQAMEVCLNDFGKEKFPFIEKAPSVEFYKDGISNTRLEGKELTLANLTNTLNTII